MKEEEVEQTGHECCWHTTDDGEWCCICEGITQPTPPVGDRMIESVDHNAESDAQVYGFIETLFGFKVDPIRLLREQSVCVACGKPGWHTHVTSPEQEA